MVQEKTSGSRSQEFIPKSYLLLKHYTWQIFRHDVLAGVTVGVIALPLAMAFAIASGVTPERGLFTAIVAGFLISLLGGSRVQIGGPTGAFVVIVYGIIARNGYDGLAVCTLIAGLILIVMGLCRAGSFIKYVPRPLITGFTTGIAVIIFSSQMKDFFGLKLGALPADFIDQWIAYMHSFSTFDLPTCLTALGTLAFILILRRFFPRIPWSISAIVVATLLTVFFHLPIETIETRFGDLPRTLPIPHLPSLYIPYNQLAEYLFDALAIAFLGGIESLLSAVISDGMIERGRHKSNCELVGQGIANLASILFGGIPATGAIARTAASVKSGARTPVAGMIHALVLFLIILFLAPLVSKIPLAALAAILVMVAWNMSEAHHFIRLLRAPWGDRSILLIAFFLTVFVDITFAIILGMFVAAFVFIKRMSQFSKSIKSTLDMHTCPPGIEAHEISGPLFFGVADMLQDLSINIENAPKVFILRMQHVPFIDASGIYALSEFLERCKKVHTKLFLVGIHGQAADDLKAFGFDRAIGASQLFPDIEDALRAASSLTNHS